MKKLLSVIAVLAMLASCCIMGIGTVALAAEESPEADFIVFDGVLEEYIGPGGDVVIPESLGIVEIAQRAFNANADVTSVVIPEGVEIIGDWAFYQMENCTSLTLPYSLLEIGQQAFAQMPITEVTIPGNLNVVNASSFSGCTYLKDVTISYGVQEILQNAFQGTATERVVFPETVELICGSAFGHNKNGTVTRIEYYICNPDCELGYMGDDINKINERNWSKQTSPWSHNVGNATYKIYVIEDSEVHKFLEEKGKALLEEVDSGKNDGLQIISKEESFFKDLEENQEGYGTPKPAEKPNTSNSDDSSDDTDNNDSTGNNSTTNNSGTKNPSTTYVDVVENDSSLTTVIIIICVFGGILLIGIIAVIILAATGKLFGSKKPAAEALDPETAALKAQIEAAKKAKELEALKAELKDLTGEEAEAVAEVESENE